MDCGRDSVAHRPPKSKRAVSERGQIPDLGGFGGTDPISGSLGHGSPARRPLFSPPMPTSTDADLLVIGAGPAGCAAAITAARTGRTVVVIDKATFPRDKTCGDGLTAGALHWLEHLEVPLSALQPSAAVTDVVVVSPSGRQVRIPLPADGEHTRVMRRADLDAALVSATRAAGVTILEGNGLTELKSLDPHVDATLDDGSTITAPFAVAADGNYSTARRLLTPATPPALGEWSAFRQYFAHVNDPRLWVLFERDVLPGYAWVFPLPDGRANVGLAVLRGPDVSGKMLAEKWRDVLERASVRAVLGPDAEPEAAHRAWPIPSHLDVSRLSHGRVLFVGDAAGVVDPMTGEGIAQALETGVLAARAITHVPHPPIGHRSLFDPASIATRYRTDVQCTLGKDLRFAGMLQRVLAKPIGVRSVLRAVDTNDWTRRNFARWMFEDYPRALVLTPSRWRRGMFTPPGAYRPA